jgi:hypothetical protein
MDDLHRPQGCEVARGDGETEKPSQVRTVSHVTDSNASKRRVGIQLKNLKDRLFLKIIRSGTQPGMVTSTEMPPL